MLLDDGVIMCLNRLSWYSRLGKGFVQQVNPIPGVPFHDCLMHCCVEGVVDDLGVGLDWCRDRCLLCGPILYVEGVWLSVLCHDKTKYILFIHLSQSFPFTIIIS